MKSLSSLKNPYAKAYTRGVKINILLYGEAAPDFGEVYYHSIEKLDDINDVGRSLDLVIDGTVCVTGSLGGTSPCQACLDEK